VQEALEAVIIDRKRDLSQFGLPSSSIFSSFIPAAPRQATPIQPLTSTLKRKAQDFRGAESHPGHSSSNRRAKTSSTSFPSALKTNVIDPADQVVTRSPRQVVVRSPSSSQTMKFCQFSSPREMANPTFLDMFLKIRLNQRNVPFGSGLTKTNTRNTGSKSRRIFVRRRGID
jgi:hypothetical protein